MLTYPQKCAIQNALHTDTREVSTNASSAQHIHTIRTTPTSGRPQQKSRSADPQSPLHQTPGQHQKGKSMEEEHAPLNPGVDPLVHARKCTICNHPERDEIENDFVYWGHPGSIIKRYGLSHRTALYRHARALKLYQARAANLRSALELIIERATDTKVTSDSIVRAVQTYAHIDS